LRDIAELADPLDKELPDGMTHEQSRLAPLLGAAEGTAGAMAIDAWMQHPGQTWLDNEMFDSLRRWKPGP
jgi:hypothetical protein